MLIASCDRIKALTNQTAEPPSPTTTAVVVPTGPPANAPSELVLEVAIGETTALLGSIKQALGASPVATLLPSNTSDLVYRMMGGIPPNVTRAIPDDAKTSVVVVRTPTGFETIFGIQVRGEAMRAASGAAPGNGEPIAIVDTPTALALLHRGVADSTNPGAPPKDVLVFGQNPALTRSLAPYVATRASMYATPEIAIDITSRGISQLRSFADTNLEAWSRSLLGSAQRERAAHAGAPTLGDPEALIQSVRGRLSRWLAYLPDVEGIRISLDPNPRRFVLDLHAAVKDASPLSRSLDAVTLTHASVVRQLPSETALAFVFAPDEQVGSGLLANMREVAGRRLDARNEATVAAAFAELAARRGRHAVVGASGGAYGPAFWYANAGETRDPISARIGGALAVPYVQSVIGTLAGCRRTARMRGFSAIAEADGNVSLRAAYPCEDAVAERPRVGLYTRDNSWVVALDTIREGIATASSEDMAQLTVRLAGGATPGSLADDPDADRASSDMIAGIGAEEVLFAGLFSPGRFASAAALPIATLRDRPTTVGQTAAFAVRRDGSQLRLYLVAPPTWLREMLIVSVSAL